MKWDTPDRVGDDPEEEHEEIDDRVGENVPGRRYRGRAARSDRLPDEAGAAAGRHDREDHPSRVKERHREREDDQRDRVELDLAVGLRLALHDREHGNPDQAVVVLQAEGERPEVWRGPEEDDEEQKHAEEAEPPPAAGPSPA